MWTRLPGQSGARPDIVYSLPFSARQNALGRDRFGLAGAEPDAVLGSGAAARYTRPYSRAASRK
ncbi:MAG: hypothetical protein AAB225_08920 [Acidobacteriota bacterium]